MVEFQEAKGWDFKREAPKLKSLLRQVMKTLGIKQTTEPAIRKIQEKWSDIVGVTLAQRGWPEEVSHGTLRIGVESEAASFEFQFEQGKILTRLREADNHFKKIVRIKIRVHKPMKQKNEE